MASIPIDSMVAAGPLRVANKRLESLLVARMRALLLMPAFGLIAVVALMRIASFGVLGAPDTPMSMEQRLLPPRGEITDRNGLPLARNYDAFALWFNPKAMKDGGKPLVHTPAEVATKLAAIFPCQAIEMGYGKASQMYRTAGFLRPLRCFRPCSWRLVATGRVLFASLLSLYVCTTGHQSQCCCCHHDKFHTVTPYWM